MNTYLWIAVGLGMGLLSFIRTSGLAGAIQLVGIIGLPIAILTTDNWTWYHFLGAYGGLFVGIKLIDQFGKKGKHM
jgi:hypothetical protein